MFLENLTDSEVLAMYKRDFDLVRERKFKHVSKVTMKKARKANRFPFADCYHCRLDNGNDYFIVSMFIDKHMMKKRGVYSVIGSIINTPRGKMYMQFTFDEKGEKCVCWYTAHYFKRYAQRIGLEEDTPFETILMHYFLENMESCQEGEVTTVNGEKRIMVSLNEGAGMAQMKNGKTVMMTFLPKDVLNGQQSKRREMLEPYRQEYAEELKKKDHWI